MKLKLFICLLLLPIAGAFSQETLPKTPETAALPPNVTLEPIVKGQRIFAAHHSYFAQVPPILDEMAKSAGVEGQVFVGTNYIGGSKSIQHWYIKDADNKAKQALQTGAVDVLVLTPIYLPDAGIEKFAQLGLEHNPDIRVTVQEFWLPFDAYEPHYYDPPKIPVPTSVDHNAQTGDSLRAIHQRYFDEMDAHVRALNVKFGKQVLFVVPAGQAVISLREKIIAGEAPGLKTQEDIFRDPLGHPKPALQALISYAHYAVIYRKSPVGLPVPRVLADLKLPAGETDKLNRLLQQLAWDAVVQHPLSGVVSK